MDKYLLNAEDVSLSSDEILQITDNATVILEYSDLEKFSNINEAFGGKDAICLLYQTKENYGHWVAIIRQSDDTIEFFDPYGMVMDQELEFSSYNLSRHDGQRVPHLTELIKANNYKVIMNKTKLQEMKSDVNTCGRHSALRIKMRHHTLSDYIYLMTKNKCYTPDMWATALTIIYSLK